MSCQSLFSPNALAALLALPLLLVTAGPSIAAGESPGWVEHQAIEGPFGEGGEVTEVCLECHAQAARDFMQTSHWTWTSRQRVAGKGWVDTGKRHAINNFCTGVASNLAHCTQCHAGYGWRDDSFDFTDPLGIDCLVCHDTTGTYRRLGGDGGVADPEVDLERVARNVGAPGRRNCGQCHFYGGGAHGVKHGDLERALVDPGVEMDVHMASEGLDFACSECHRTRRHAIPGTTMGAAPGGTATVRCIDCHPGDVHESRLLNHHVASVACQTCHIPRYAKGEPTKVFWDWSRAGQGSQPRTNAEGRTLYDPVKGVFDWDSDVEPHYAWSDGRAGIYQWGERFDPSSELKLNWPIGSRDDPAATIAPFKLHRGRQIYDREYNYLVNAHVYGLGAFEETFDWDRSARDGMRARGLPYSGRYGFADTVMYWRINHMVAPAGQALQCRDCHGREQKRLDWRALGYEGDPLFFSGQSRNPIVE